MCGFAGIVSLNPQVESHLDALNRALGSMKLRGPDAGAVSAFPHLALGHNRLSIIDLTNESNQPFHSHCKRYTIAYNGEIYNYIELRERYKNQYPFQTQSDTEVLLAAYIIDGPAMLNQLNGMFAFVIWDHQLKTLFGARDRFGVKPFYYSQWKSGYLVFASEIKALHESGWIQKEANLKAWSQYLVDGIYDHNEETFYQNIDQVPAGHSFLFELENPRKLIFSKWYTGLDHLSIDERGEEQVREELSFLLEDAIKLRFRADVPVGICLSGGLDSSLLLALVHKTKGKDFPIHAFTFFSGDIRYDELPWVEESLKGTQVHHHRCLISPKDVIDRAEQLQYQLDGPYGGIPTIAMNLVFEKAQQLGIKVLLDGNGMDEAWAGYEYYQHPSMLNSHQGPIQGSRNRVLLRDYLSPKLLQHHEKAGFPQYHQDPLIQAQLLDLKHKKIPRAMRFADRNSMSQSVELREPFLDYRLVELGLKQKQGFKIKDGQGKYLVRRLAHEWMGKSLIEAPKRPVQTPQGEWFRKELYAWMKDAFKKDPSNWVTSEQSITLLEAYKNNPGDNSYYLWQLLSAGW